MFCEPLLIVFIVYEVLVAGVIFPTFPACIAMYNSSAYNKSPFNNYTWCNWCCIAAAGNRATIPLGNVVPHKCRYFGCILALIV